MLLSNATVIILIWPLNPVVLAILYFAVTCAPPWSIYFTCNLLPDTRNESDYKKSIFFFCWGWRISISHYHEYCYFENHCPLLILPNLLNSPAFNNDSNNKSTFKCTNSISDCSSVFGALEVKNCTYVFNNSTMSIHLSTHNNSRAAHWIFMKPDVEFN